MISFPAKCDMYVCRWSKDEHGSLISTQMGQDKHRQLQHTSLRALGIFSHCNWRTYRRSNLAAAARVHRYITGHLPRHFSYPSPTD